MVKLYNKVKIVARKLIKETEAPIKLNPILDDLNVVKLECKFEKEGALLYRDAEDKIILVNKDQPLGQKRFNIAHEIGHLALNHKGIIMQSSSHPLKQNKSKKEKEADVFASELLIPSTCLKREAFKCQFDVQQLKRKFKVSEQAMVVKMKILNLPYKNTRY